MMKVCNKCRMELSGENFSVRRASADGLSYTCKKCESERAKHRYKTDESVRAAAKERAKAWAATNPYKRLAITRSYTNRNLHSERERKSAYARRFRNENPEKAKMKGRIAAQKRRIRMIDARGYLHPGLVKRLLQLADGVCVYCGEKNGPLTIDHFFPVSLGGDGQIWNLVPCCGSCNSSKKDRDGGAWLERRFGLSRVVEVVHAIEALVSARLP